MSKKDMYNTDKQIPKNKGKGSIKFRKTKNDRRSNSEPDNKGDFQWKRGGRTAIIWIIFIIGMLFIYQMMNSMQLEGEQLITYFQYREFLESEKIESAEVVDREMRGVLRQQETIMKGGQAVPVMKFKVILPEFYKEMEAEWRQYNVRYNFRKKEIEWSTIFFSTLPWIIIIVIWLYFFRRLQSGGTKGIFSFGKSKAKLLIEDKPQITFDDVAGADEAKLELQEIIEFLKSPDKFQKLGGKIPKGALLIGPPGTGKTLLARAIAGEAGVPFFSISGADFVEMFVGVGASRVRDLFEQGKKNAPCIIFIDEIDAVGRSRGTGLGGGHDEREQTLNALLVEMDGFEHNEGVILIAATNRPDVLDTALLRPGRFDRQIVVDRPDVRGREGILRVHTKKIPLHNEVDLSIIAKGTPGMAGADLANIVNEAALQAARKNKEKVDMEDFEQAKDKVMMGMERKTMVITEEEKRSTAYHESGHVLVAKLIPESDPIHKVTIIPRGRALGVTTSLPLDERHTYSKQYCEATIAKMMGGRAAERLVFNHLSTGAGNDIEQATNLARKMVCEWGMSNKLGPLTFGKKDEEIFLGREIATHRDYSEKTAQVIDAEVRGIVESQEKRAEKILRDNIGILHELSSSLLKKEILDSREIDSIIDKDKKKAAPSDGKKAKAEGSKIPRGYYRPVKTEGASAKGSTQRKSRPRRRPPKTASSAAKARSKSTEKPADSSAEKK